MHIKQIVLAGFKSYRDETTVHDLDKGLNVIVGKNGSGKTNIFGAIRYVLDEGSDASSLRNSGAERGQECFVELIFDNADQRFLTLPEEVSIKRSVDTPGDYWVNGRKTKQREVLNLFESAGFGSSGFYIVPQGKVASLINASDAERLNQFLEASGLMVFERKKRDSKLSLKKTKDQITEIDTILEHLGSRVNELEAEKEELARYEAAGTKHKELVSVEVRREREQIMTRLETVKVKLSGLRAQQAKEQAQLAEYEQEKKLAEAKLMETKIVLDTIGVRPSASLSDSQSLSAHNAGDLIKDAEADVAKWTATLEKARADSTANQENIDAMDAKLRGLLVKQAQLRFPSKEERDEWLQAQVEVCRKEQAEGAQKVAQLEAEIADIDVPMIDSQRVDELTQQMEAHKDIVHEKQQLVAAAQGKLRQAQLERRKNEIIVQNLSDQITAMKLPEADTVGAIEQARQIAIELGLEQKFHGPVANLMEIDEMFAPAAEAVAKGALFYCVVDDIATVKQLTKELTARKLPRVSFIPLSQVRAKEQVKVEANDVEDVAPLMDQIKCDPKYQAAVDLVVSSALLCSNLETGWRCSRAYNVECVTVEGSLVSPFGALRGGSAKQSPVSRFAAIREIVQLYQRRAEAEKLVNDSEVNAAQQQISVAHNMVTAAKSAVTSLFSELDGARRDYNHQKQAVAAIEERLSSKKSELELVRQATQDYATKQAQYAEELGCEFEAADPEEIKRLEAELKELKTAQANTEELITTASREVEFASQRLWDASLLAEREFAEPEPSTAAENQQSEDYNAAQAQFSALRETLADLTVKLSESEAKLEAVANDISRTEFGEEKWNELLEINSRDANRLESYFYFECDDSDAELAARRERAHAEWTRSKSCNKYAAEQHAKYSHEFEHHEQMRQQLQRDFEAGEKMVEDLDKYKSEAIEQVFKRVNKDFSEFFKHLTQNDAARLTVSGGDAPLEWTGISITAEFAGHRSLRVEQLSGGQKALCALAFLLALQASERAPFYIFDEVDASLDSQYRSYLASLLNTMTTNNGPQCICTTFSPELVRASDKVYGTAFGAGTSTASEIDQETALTLVDASASEAS